MRLVVAAVCGHGLKLYFCNADVLIYIWCSVYIYELAFRENFWKNSLRLFYDTRWISIGRVISNTLDRAESNFRKICSRKALCIERTIWNVSWIKTAIALFRKFNTEQLVRDFPFSAEINSRFSETVSILQKSLSARRNIRYISGLLVVLSPFHERKLTLSSQLRVHWRLNTALIFEFKLLREIPRKDIGVRLERERIYRSFHRSRTDAGCVLCPKKGYSVIREIH